MRMRIGSPLYVLTRIIGTALLIPATIIGGIGFLVLAGTFEGFSMILIDGFKMIWDIR
jgi:hypothetical protein